MTGEKGEREKYEGMSAPTKRYRTIFSSKNGKEIKLKLNVRNRTHGNNPASEIHLLTFTLINLNSCGTENIRNEDFFFQVSFSVGTSEKCFLPYKVTKSKTDKAAAAVPMRGTCKAAPAPRKSRQRTTAINRHAALPLSRKTATSAS